MVLLSRCVEGGAASKGKEVQYSVFTPSSKVKIFIKIICKFTYIFNKFFSKLKLLKYCLKELPRQGGGGCSPPRPSHSQCGQPHLVGQAVGVGHFAGDLLI